MKIKSIKLVNFRQFANLFLDFSTEKERNVSVVLAENSTGKTTLMQSIKWCLYGEEETKLDNLSQLLNFDTLKNSIEDTEDVIVELKILANDTEYIIKRSQTNHVPSNKKANEIISITYKNNEGETIKLEDNIRTGEKDLKKINRIINGIMTKEMSNYFLFDGERIDNLGKNNRKSSEDIKEAINAINNFNIIDNSLATLYKIQNGYRRRISDESNDKQLQTINQEMDLLTEEIQTLENEEDELESERTNATQRVSELDEELRHFDEVSSLTEEREQLEKNIDKNQNNNENLEKNILNLYQRYNRKKIIYLLNEKYKKLDFNEDYEDKTVQGIEAKAIDALIERGVCICGEELTPEHIEHLEIQRDYQPPISNAQLIIDFNRVINNHTVGIDQNASDFDRYMIEHSELQEKILNTKERIKELNNQIGKSNSKEIKEKNKEREELNKNIKEYESQIIRCEIRREEAKEKLESLKKAYNKILEKNKEHRYNRIKIDLLDETINALEKRNESFRKQQKETIETLANKHFSDIIYKNKNIIINDEFKYSVIEGNVSGKNKNIPTASPSEGERVAISMSLVLAMIEAHKKSIEKEKKNIVGTSAKEFCLILDAAFATLDNKFSQKISDKLPEAVEQVILFSTEKQYNGAVKKSLEPSIGKKFKISLPHDKDSNSITDKELTELR